MSTALAVLGVVLMLLGLALIPLGLPGLWLMVGVLTVATVSGAVGWATLGAVVALGVGAEIAEFAALQRFSVRYGGDSRAFAAAVVGGLAGAALGTPLPVVGSVVGLLAGTFAGAALVTWYRTRDRRASVRVGWGTVLGRAAAAAVKVTAGLITLAAGVAALFGG